MSHFSRIKTKITNKEYLKEALKKLDYAVRENTVCTGYQGNTVNADIVIDLPDTNYNLAFVNNGNSYDLVADWYGIKGMNSSVVISEINKEIEIIENKIKQEYAYSTTIEKLAEQGFSIDEEARENGEIRIKLSRIV